MLQGTEGLTAFAVEDLRGGLGDADWGSVNCQGWVLGDRGAKAPWPVRQCAFKTLRWDPSLGLILGLGSYIMCGLPKIGFRV